MTVAIKELVKALLGEKVVGRYKVYRRRRLAEQAVHDNFRYDQERFTKSSTTLNTPYDGRSLAAQIMMDAHRIEKGMALPSPRPGFGAEIVQRLVDVIPEAEAQFGRSLETQMGRAALQEYAAFHSAAGFPIPEGLARFLTSDEAAQCAAPGGTMLVKKAEIRRASHIDFDAFAKQRFSVRNFTGEPVPLDLIEKAVQTAIKSPSVCNRQSARVHIALDRERIQEALSYQNGNRGFGELLGALVVVTSDMRNFVSIGERNQCWVDGGLFAMSLCYALHALGLGTCMLNWSVANEQDLKMRRALGIPDHEAVITMMAVGHMPESFRVAVSPRLTTGEVLRVIP